MEDRKNLTNLKVGEKAVVSELTSLESIRRRLQDIGLIEGTEVECVGISPLGDPAAFFIRGAVIALRSEEAGQVLIKPGPDADKRKEPAMQAFPEGEEYARCAELGAAAKETAGLRTGCRSLTCKHKWRKTETKREEKQWD